MKNEAMHKNIPSEGYEGEITSMSLLSASVSVIPVCVFESEVWS
jgi:hypothetical protein